MMKRSAMTRLNIHAATALAVVCLVSVLVACGDRQGAKDDDEQTSAKAASAPSPKASQPANDANKPLALTPAEMREAHIRVEALQLSSVMTPVSLTGSVSPNQDRIARVVPRLPGRITSVPAALGAQVMAGQTLAVLESIELGEARSALLQARSEASVADAAFARAEKLSAEDIVPRKDYLRAKADAERARAALRAASDKLRMLGVSPTVPEDHADAVYSLVAPLSGTIIEKQAVPGTLADKEPLFTVADLSNVWVITDVFERDLSRIAVGSAAEVTIAAYPNERFPGRLAYLSDTLDAATRTVKARIEVANPQRRLKPGMFASASLVTIVMQQALVLPSTAVTLIEGKPTVFIKTDGGFVPRTVETAGELGGMVTLRQGVNAGERVVVDGAYALKSRMLKSQLGSND